MSFPLIITTADGDILYAARRISVKNALKLFASAAAKSKKDGIVYFEGKAIYTKEALLSGRRLRFFMDADKLYECFGVPVDKLSNGLFSIGEPISKSVPLSLRSLVGVFVSAYSEMLFEDGIRISVHKLASDVTVKVSAGAFALCLALMVRLCGSDAVNLSFAAECGRVSVFADSACGAPASVEAREVLEMLLYEASAASGFAVEEFARGRKKGFELKLTPLDISLLGLKTDVDEAFKKRARVYIEMFL